MKKSLEMWTPEEQEAWRPDPSVSWYPEEIEAWRQSSDNVTETMP